MKKILLGLVLICTTTAYAQRDVTGATNLARYANVNASITKRVVFLGNSITDAWPSVSPEFFAENNYIGRGIGGQTSLELLLRFRQDVINLSPTAVVINIGTNDIAQNSGEYNPQLTMDCIQSMAELADYNGIKVILSSVLPVDEYPWRKEIKNVVEKIDTLNEMIKSYAQSKGFAYIDYNTPMREPNGAMKANLARDGVHPTKEGYIIMEGIAKKVIDTVIRF